MGNHPRKEKDENICYFHKIPLNTIQLNQKVLDSRFGETIIGEDIIRNEQIIIKEYFFENEEGFKQEIADMKKKLLQIHPFILRIYGYDYSKEGYICSSLVKMYLFIEYIRRDLNMEVTTRRLQNWPYSDTEINYFLGNLIEALAFLQGHNRSHGNIRNNTIFIYQNNSSFKICDPMLFKTTNNFMQVLSNPFIKGVYLCPLLAMAVKNKDLFPEVNQYKSDVFTLGCIALEFASLARIDSHFDYKNGEIDMKGLTEKLNGIKQHYSLRTYELISSMLEFNQRKRPDFIQIFRTLAQKDHESSRISSAFIQVHTKAAPLKDESDKNDCKIIGPSLRFEPSEITSSKYSPTSPRPTTFEIYREDEKFNKRSPLDITSYNQGNNSFENRKVCLRDEEILEFEISKIQQQQQPQNKRNYEGKEFEGSLMLEANNQNNISFEAFINKRVEAQIAQLETVHKPELRKLSLLNTKNLSANNSVLNKSDILSKSLINDKSFVKEVVREVYQDGSVFEGEKINGLREGKGKFLYSDGGFYDGEWRGGKMSGFGVLYYKSNIKAYEGMWLDDQFDGKGVIYNETPAQVMGRFDYSDFDNMGEFWTKYDGYFRNDNKNGVGTIFLSNKDWFTGSFENDVASGRGTYFEKEGKIISGEWKNNKLVKTFNMV